MATFHVHKHERNDKDNNAKCSEELPWGSYEQVEGIKMNTF